MEDGELTQSVYVRSNRGKMFSSIAAGTEKGEIWTIMHPFKDEGVNKQLVHRGAVTRLAQTSDQKILFSAGEDGSLFVFKIGEEKIKDERE